MTDMVVVVNDSTAATVAVVREPTTTVSVSAPGPQGPRGTQGPQGLPGTPGGNGFPYTQSVPASTWIIDHNLGRKVHVSLFDPDGKVVFADVEHGTVNQATVTYPSPMPGSAFVS